MINDPITELTLALANAEVPEEQINFALLEEMRRYMDSPIDGSVKYLGSTNDGEQFSACIEEFYDASQSLPIFCVARCRCGWFDYFSSFELAPAQCPRCSAELPMVQP